MFFDNCMKLLQSENTDLSNVGIFDVQNIFDQLTLCIPSKKEKTFVPPSFKMPFPATFLHFKGTNNYKMGILVQQLFNKNDDTYLEYIIVFHEESDLTIILMRYEKSIQFDSTRLGPCRTSFILHPAIANSRNTLGVQRAFEIYNAIFGNFLNFYHCKNIISVSSPLSKGYKKARSRRGHLPIDCTYTLVLTNSFNPTSKSVSSEKVDVSSLSFHFTRGHFRNYGQNAPLFGRFVGTFWIPAHAKGNKDHGTIKKNYRVST